MMRAIVTLCVRHFGAVTALTVLALMLGCWGALQAPLDVFPEFVPSQVDIQTEAPGIRAAASRGTGHQAGRERRQWRRGARDDALRIDSRACRS